MSVEAEILKRDVSQHQRRVYLDHSLRCPLRPEAAEIWKSANDLPLGIAWSPYRSGRRAADFLEECRQVVARSLYRGEDSKVCFYSSFVAAAHTCLDAASVHGRGAASTVFLSVAESATMREAVLSWSSLRKWHVVEVPCDPSGCCVMAEWSLAFSKLKDRGAIVVCCSANSEVGTLQPGEELATAASKAGCSLVRDVSSVHCWMEPRPEILSGDFLVGSASRMGAADFGAFAVFRGGPPQLSEPEPVILAAAVKAITENWCRDSAGCVRRMREIRAFFSNRLTTRLSNLIQLATIGEEQRLPHVLGVRFAGVETEALSLVCDLKGVEFSSSPACVSLAAGLSHFLLALGLTPKETRECCTLAIGPQTSREETEFAAEIISSGVRRVQSI